MPRSKELVGAGFPNPNIRNYDDKPIDIRAIDKPIDVLMDLEPRNDETKAFAGRALDDYPVIGAMLSRAMAEGKPVASDPITCCGRTGRSASCWRRPWCRTAPRSRRASSPFPTSSPR